MTHEQQELGTAMGAELLRQAQLWQRAPHWGISLPSFKSSVRADQLERDPLPVRAYDCPPSGGEGEEAEPTLGHQAQWLYRAAGWQSVPTLLYPHPLLCLPAKNLLDKEVPPVLSAVNKAPSSAYSQSEMVQRRAEAAHPGQSTARLSSKMLRALSVPFPRLRTHQMTGSFC